MPNEIEDFFEYGALCVFSGRTEYINDIVVFSRETKPLINSRKRMQFILMVKQASYNAQKKGVQNIEASYRRARSSGKYSREQLERLEKEIYEAKEHLYAFREEIDALKADIEDIENEIYRIGKLLFGKYSEFAERIRNEESVCAKMLKWIYLSPDSLYRALNLSELEYELYQMCGVYFNVPKHIFAEQKRQDSSRERKEGKYQRQQKEKSYQEQKHSERHGQKKYAQEKPYGEHWFSPTAYTDLKALRKEYHKLAAKYHPDNNPDGVEAFLEIQKEREKILNNLKE